MHEGLIGIGLYTPTEASRLTRVSAAKIARWLRGHDANGHHYQPLWQPQIQVDDGRVTLGFRDLMEVRVAASFIGQGLSPFRVRRAIVLAREIVGEDRPLSTQTFRTDGRSIFLQVVHEEGDPDLINLFSQQYTFHDIIERSLNHVDFDEAGAPALWWPLGRAASIVVDPTRAFGQPIEAETSVPVAALIGALRSEGSPEAVARTWAVPVRAVERALEFHAAVQTKSAA